MRRTALALLALCGGCYPWLPGSWDDYAMPDQVQLFASAVHVEKLGGYWSDDTPEAELWWGWSEEPMQGVTALDMIAPGGPGCVRGEPSETVVTSLLIDPGAAASVLRGPDVFELPYNELRARFEAYTEDIGAGSYDLDPVQSDNAGVIEAYPLLSVPAGVPIEGPPLAGPIVNNGTLDGLNFTWDASNPTADWFLVEASISGLTSSGFVPYEWVVCLVPFGDGELSVPEVMWEDGARADAVYITMGTVDEIMVPVGDQDVAASGLGARLSQGILRL